MVRKPIRAGRAVRQRARELRQEGTIAESLLWARLRGRQLEGLKFRRQHPIGRFIVDFYCATARIVVELDGGIHATQRERDAERTAMLIAQGYRVIRFENEAVVHDIESVLAEIADAVGSEPSFSLSRSQGAQERKESGPHDSEFAS